MRNYYLRSCDALAAATRPVVMALMAAMTVNVLVGVFFRYVVGDALTWTEETARYMMIWMGFLATGLALREGGHVAMDFLLDRLPATVHRPVVAIIRSLCLVYLVAVIGAGVLLLIEIRAQRSPVLAISMVWPYLAIPVGCLLTAFEMVVLMLRDPAGDHGRDVLLADITAQAEDKACS
jgi:TRAP-type transport system small permease protein